MKSDIPAPVFLDDDEDFARQREKGFSTLLREVAATEREVARILGRQALRKARGEDARGLAMIEMEARHLKTLRELAAMGRSLAELMYGPTPVRAVRPTPPSRDVEKLRAMRPASPSRH